MSFKLFGFLLLFLLIVVIVTNVVADSGGKGECVPGKSYYDGCNTCYCHKSGFIGCTSLSCKEIDLETGVSKEVTKIPPPPDFWKNSIA
ncbi:hypothetical protein K0M31_007139 [Melipona bicolor]|uniref:Pacifastin domain-containing protein n=1 Tax=Melipona bicolor TaxID=60889 RepID=A0AA40FRP6_9HYME|nr:hypothetical protein K0M31_007139 [Melipona bicolor]